MAAHVSLGSWVAGGLTCRKSAAVAEPKSDQVYGRCVCCVLRRAPRLPRPGPPCVTHIPLRSTLHCLVTMGALGTSRKLPLGGLLLLCMDLFTKFEENITNNCTVPLQTEELEVLYVPCTCVEIMCEIITMCFLYNWRETDNVKVWFICPYISKTGQMNQSLKVPICL